MTFIRDLKGAPIVGWIESRVIRKPRKSLLQHLSGVSRESTGKTLLLWTSSHHQSGKDNQK